MFCNDPESVKRTTVPSKRNRKRKKKSVNPQYHKKIKQVDQTSLNVQTAMPNWGRCCHDAATWQFKHDVAFWKARAKSLEYENRVLHDTIKKMYFQNFVQPSTSRDDAAQFPEAYAKTFEDETESEDDVNGDEDVNDEESDDDDVEVSEEFIQFLKENAKYKENVMREKEEMRAKRDAEDKELVEDNNLESSEDKRARFIDLYGADWERIMALETSLSCNFINECDKERPKYWPNIPLNFYYC